MPPVSVGATEIVQLHSFARSSTIVPCKRFNLRPVQSTSDLCKKFNLRPLQSTSDLCSQPQTCAINLRPVQSTLDLCNQPQACSKFNLRPMQSTSDLCNESQTFARSSTSDLYNQPQTFARSSTSDLCNQPQTCAISLRPVQSASDLCKKFNLRPVHEVQPRTLHQLNHDTRATTHSVVRICPRQYSCRQASPTKHCVQQFTVEGGWSNLNTLMDKRAADVWVQNTVPFCRHSALACRIASQPFLCVLQLFSWALRSCELEIT